MADNKFDSVLSELYLLCTDRENKPGDRIAAAKLLLEYLKEGQYNGSDIKIVFDGIDESVME